MIDMYFYNSYSVIGHSINNQVASVVNEEHI